MWSLSSDKKGISSCQLARNIEVTQKTAWFMLQKIRDSYKFENTGKLFGEVEADESYFGGKNKNRHWDKKVKNSQGRSCIDKTPVLGMVQRNGKLIAKVIKNVSGKVIAKQLFTYVKLRSTLYTDEWSGYNTASKFYERKVVFHGKG